MDGLNLSDDDVDDDDEDGVGSAEGSSDDSDDNESENATSAVGGGGAKSRHESVSANYFISEQEMSPAMTTFYKNVGEMIVSGTIHSLQLVL